MEEAGWHWPPKPRPSASAVSLRAVKQGLHHRTSSHRLNLRPTSRSMPTSSKPHDSCRAIDASLAPEIRANTAWNPDAAATREQLVDDQLADALAVAVAAHVDGVLDAGAVRGALLVRRQRRRSRRPRPVRRRIDGHDGGERTIAIGDPLLLLLQRSGHEVERGRRVATPRSCRSDGSARRRRRTPIAA